jgi:cell wall-associated NlpC family hydrolase
MKAIVVLATLLLFSLSFIAQTKSYDRLYSIYEKNKPQKLLSKASKLRDKDARDPVAYYFLSLGYYQLYEVSNNTGRCNKAVYYLKRAKSYDKERIYWKLVEKDILPIKKLIRSKVNYLCTINKKKAIKLSEDYLELFGDSLPEYAQLLKNTELKLVRRSSGRTNFTSSSKTKRDSIKWIAEKYVGVPYKWAGESPTGFDCSGYVKYVFSQVGVKLPHNANRISYLGKEISESKAQTGDVILFGTRTAKGHRAYHAGIIYENRAGQIKIIHCISKGVHITSDYDKYWKSRKMLITNVLDYPSKLEVSQVKK